MAAMPRAARALETAGLAEESPIAIRFTDDRRPESATRVSWDAFDGPLALLLSLIEQRQMDILTVRLGDLAGAYLEAMASFPGDRLPHLSAFVTVASQLILIKSRALLPPVPGAEILLEVELEDPEEELRRRLLAYRAFRDVGAALGRRLAEGASLFHREAAIATAAGFAGARPEPAPPLPPSLLAEALAAAIALVPPPSLPPGLVARTVSLAERADIIRAALRGAPAFVLQDLLADVRDRVVMAVTFLALLELVKRREVAVEQAEPWGPIRCRRTTAAERAASRRRIKRGGRPSDETDNGHAPDRAAEAFAADNGHAPNEALEDLA